MQQKMKDIQKEVPTQKKGTDQLSRVFDYTENTASGREFGK